MVGYVLESLLEFQFSICKTIELKKLFAVKIPWIKFIPI